ncbi:MAG: Na+/H+ antiporter NhaC family protein [Brevinema sp.]
MFSCYNRDKSQYHQIKRRMSMKNTQASFKGIIPFLVFIILYLGAGIAFHMQGVGMAFYQLPAPMAMLAAIIVAFMLFRGSIQDKFNHFVDGCGNHDIMIMCMVYILAGAFATVTKAIGGVESAANLGLSIIPPQYIAAGIFTIACFISISIGTSVGTIVALGPIGIDLASKSGVSAALIIAAILGGAMFGDNLSFISDTTIAATRSQKCDMKDKFRVNSVIAFPAAIITIILLLIFGRPETIVTVSSYEYNWVTILPYLFVLIAAANGLNVFIVLVLSTIFAGVIGFASGAFTFMGWVNQVYNGFTGMTEIFLLSLFTGGLARMSKEEGGISWILKNVKKMIQGKKTAELGVGILSSLTGMATANNTVAIIIAGPVAKEISNKYDLEPKRVASLLDIFASIVQGILPYGAQMLIILSFTQGAVGPVEVIPFMWYSFLLLGMTIISIMIPKKA